MKAQAINKISKNYGLPSFNREKFLNDSAFVKMLDKYLVCEQLLQDLKTQYQNFEDKLFPNTTKLNLKYSLAYCGNESLNAIYKKHAQISHDQSVIIDQIIEYIFPSKLSFEK